MKPVELLAPAGTLKNMHYAFAYGADAVYAGQPRYSLRVRNNDFLDANLAIGISEAHRQGKKFYLTSNLMPHNSKLKTFIEDMRPIIAMGPDALIMADPGLIMMVRETWPEMPVHLSVQANTVNYAAVRFWQSVGITRIILSRELSLEEIAEIRQHCPDMELEVFVHGALCIAYSGRCLLSGYFNHRDPNQGSCTNSCRWSYSTTPAVESAEGTLLPQTSALGEQRHPQASQPVFLQEKQRAGEFMPMEEDEHGTYIMNSRDLRAIEHVQRLLAIGVDCLKIEGRTKSYYYVSRTTQAYRQAMDDALAGRAFDPQLLGALENLAHRGYTDGFYQRHHDQQQQNYLQGSSESNQQQFVGEVVAHDARTGLADVEVKNKFCLGDRLELVQPAGNRSLVLAHMEDMQGQAMTEAPGGGYRVRIPLDAADARYGLIARYL